MIPSLGDLTNSGSMPISANGGQAGPSNAVSKASYGGIKSAAINFNGPSHSIVWVALAIGGTWWLCTH